MTNVKASQLGGAEVLASAASTFLIDAAEACREAGAHGTQKQLYQLAERTSAIIDELRQQRTEALAERKAAS